jgi:hypothetical protein
LPPIVRQTGRDRSVQGNVNHPLTQRSQAGYDAQGARPSGIARENSLFAQGPDVVHSAAHAVKTEMGGNIAQTRGNSLVMLALLDKIENLLLTFSKFAHNKLVKRYRSRERY